MMAFRILMIAPTPFFSDRGTHIRIFEEAKGLSKRGHAVEIVTYHLGNNPFEEETVTIHRIPRLLFWYSKREAGASWQKILLDILLLVQTLAVALRFRPTFLHGHLHEGTLIGWFTKKILFWRAMKLVGDFHSTLASEMVSDSYLAWKPLRAIFEKLDQIITTLPDACITSGEALARELREKRPDVTPVLDGVDLSAYEHLPPSETCRKELGLPTDGPLVAFTGSFLPNKGIDLLFHAILETSKREPAIHWLLGGFPKDRAEEFVREHGLNGRVTIVSPLAFRDLPRLLTAVTIGVDPKHDVSISQASGKILHYMAAGLPVVCFDTPANRAYLGEGGIYASRATSGEFAQAILNLLQDSKKIQELGNTNRERIRQFTSEAAAKKLEAIYICPTRKASSKT